jgi:HK97 family phage major capsid protein
MPPSKRADAIWLANPLLEAGLLGMVIPNTTIPAYLPPNGLAGVPFGTLFGRPIVYSELVTTALGVEGDLLFVDMKEIICAHKSSGVRQDISTHFYFDRDTSCYRILVRMGFKHKLTAPVTRPDGTEIGPIISLATRSA